MNTLITVTCVLLACLVALHALPADPTPPPRRLNVSMLLAPEPLAHRVRRQQPQQQFIRDEHNVTVGCNQGWTWQRYDTFNCCFGTRRRCCSNVDLENCWE